MNILSVVNIFFNCQHFFSVRQFFKRTTDWKDWFLDLSESVNLAMQSSANSAKLIPITISPWEETEHVNKHLKWLPWYQSSFVCEWHLVRGKLLILLLFSNFFLQIRSPLDWKATSSKTGLFPLEMCLFPFSEAFRDGFIKNRGTGFMVVHC